MNDHNNDFNQNNQDNNQNQQPSYDLNDMYKQMLYHKYSELGGWLLFFVIMAILGLTSLVYSIPVGIASTVLISSQLSSTYTLVTIAFQFSSLFSSVFMLLYVIAVFKRNPKFMRYWQIGALISLFFSALYILFIFTYANFPVEFSIFLTIFTVFTSIGSLALYTAYYSKSVRVRIYFRESDYLDKALFAFRG